jgi:AcrR family transcriptional regulator
VAGVGATARREAIFKATCREVIARGFGGTRVADVAGALGISTGLVFYHFVSKDRLLAEAFRSAARADLERLAAIVEGGGPAMERLDRILRLYAPGPSSQAWALWIDAWSQVLRSPALQRVSRDLDLRWKETVMRVICDGVAAGECSCADPGAAAWRLTALLDGLAVQMVVHRGVLWRRELLAWVRGAAASELGLAPAGAREGLSGGRAAGGGAAARLAGRGGSA